MIWQELMSSEDSRLVRIADELAPHLSIQRELDVAKADNDTPKIEYINGIMRKYTWNEALDERSSLRALKEIRGYKYFLEYQQNYRSA